MINYTKYFIHKESNLIDALKLMDSLDSKLLIVMEDDKFFSLLSIGDIQRYLLLNNSLDATVQKALRKQIKVSKVGDSDSYIKAQMLKYRITFMPVINPDRTINKVIYWEELFEEKEKVRSKVKVPVVIMAGGKGTRLKPITNIIPKPLIPLGDETILEIILKGFNQAGVKKFYISVNYKSEMIKQYFMEKGSQEYELEFFQEDKPLGTAGSLTLLSDTLTETFIVTNCDILINEDYSEILKYHYKNKNELTAVAAIKHRKIPYGVFSVTNNGVLRGIEEKPEYTYLINAGMYILEPSLLAEIPRGRIFHITDLMNKLLHENRRVGVFPVSDGSWSDIGEWSEYKNTAKKLGLNYNF